MIILTVPYKSYQNILHAMPDGADFIEYRFDYGSDLIQTEWNRFDAKSILTFRDQAEGGKQQISSEQKCYLINESLRASKALIDCEYQFLIKHSGLSIPSERLILSLHTDIDKYELIKSFIETQISAKYYKLAVSCQSITELDEITDLIKKNKPDNFIIIPTYPCSLSARLLYKLYHSCATYVHNAQPVISNQPSLDLITKCRIETINSDTLIYAIIGKEQILDSLSVYVYNQWFKQTNQNKVFLPIVANSAEEAGSLICWIRKRAMVKGVAVTMPFKQTISSLINDTQQIVNSWLPETNTFTNTDEIAMKQAIEHFNLDKTDSILIYGRGATAQTAQHILAQLGFTDITQLNRKDKSHNKTYQLLINCTPFGLKKSDQPDILPEYSNLIDLPYGKQTTSLVSKAVANKLDYIDGFVFWKWQAKAQAEFFGLEFEFKDNIDSVDLPKLIQ